MFGVFFSHEKDSYCGRWMGTLRSVRLTGMWDLCVRVCICSRVCLWSVYIRQAALHSKHEWTGLHIRIRGCIQHELRLCRRG